MAEQHRQIRTRRWCPVVACILGIVGLGYRIHALAAVRATAGPAARVYPLGKQPERYHRLVSDSNSVIISFGRDGRFTYANPFALRFFGYTERELLGKPLVGTIVPPASTRGRDLDAMIRDIIRHPDAYATNLNQNMKKGGERVYLVWSNAAIVDARGRVAEVVSVGTPVTEMLRTAGGGSADRGANLLRGGPGR